MASIFSCTLLGLNASLANRPAPDVVLVDGRDAVGPQIVRAYLSRQHFEDVDDSCPMVALPGDVARSGGAAKRAVRAAFTPS